MANEVCVTGGSGFIGSWVVRLLLERGYSVHAAVRNLNDENETKHLRCLQGADSRLRLFQIDLLDYVSIVSAARGCSGIFPLSFSAHRGSSSKSRELLEPAIKGTLNVLTAAMELGVGRLVVTSSASAITPSPNWPADVVKREECWADVDYCKRTQLWYPLSNTLAEKAAWDFAKEKGLDVVVVNPGAVFGPILPPTISSSTAVLLRLLKGTMFQVPGSTETYQDFYMGPVHVKDVALAHILVYEKKSASGRHLCIESISHFGDFATKVAEMYPEYNVPRLPSDTQPGLLRAKDGGKKLMDLGLEFIPLETIIKEAVESLKSKGFIS